jgi:hypothetical protein
MKLRFLCANHREWLCRQPGEAVHRYTNSFETGWHLSQQEQWGEALPHMGCAFETAEILMTTRAIAPAGALEWFIQSLAGLTQILLKLDRTTTCIEVYHAAVDRLRKESTQKISPELEASIYQHITRLNRERRCMHDSATWPGATFALVESKRGEIVYH